MRLRKMAAGVIAAAMAVASLPQAVSAEPEFGVGDTFYVSYDGSTGEAKGEPTSGYNLISYECTILNDGTISVGMLSSPAWYAYHGNKITIPDTIAGYTVTQLSNIDYRCGFASVTIPDTVTTISQGAFSENVFLEEINFGANSQLKLIDQWAFQDCRSLKMITIPASVETIAYGVFANTEQKLVANIAYGSGDFETFDFTNVYSLKTVKFAEGSKLKAIGQGAFGRQKALTSIELPEGVKTISGAAFADCEALKNVTIPASVEIIGTLEENSSVFDGCTSLEEVSFAENSNLKTIGNMAFANAPALKSITLPANVEKIGIYAFNRAYNLNDDVSAPIPTPSIMTNIYVDENNKTFKSVDGVVYSKDGTELVAYPIGRNEELVIPEGVTKIKEGVCQGAYITSLTIPSTVTEISTDAFCHCYNLIEVNLPETLTTIGKWAFQRAAFTSIEIPASVKAIDSTAFEDSKLKTIYGVEGSYAETYAKENGYDFNGTPAETNTFKDDSEDKAADIEVIDNKGAIPKEAHFSVRIDNEHSSETRIAYNCYFTYNGANYEPTDVVTVRIPVPVQMQDQAKDLKVYHLQDGKYVAMKVEYVEENGFGYLVFETDHFSIYVVTPETISEDGGEDTTDTEPAPSTRPNTGDFIIPETTTTTATAADTTSAPQAAETTATVADTTTTATTTTTAAPEATTAAPASDNGTAEQPVSADSTSDNSSANVGNDGAANGKGENPDTGVAIAIVPMIVATAAISFIAYKRKK